MKKTLLLSLVVLALFGSCLADDREKDIERIQQAGQVLDEVMGAPDHGIPQQVMDSAECVAVVPSMLKAGFGFGAALGKGVVTCRNPNGWSAPAFFRIEGGSFGFQIGGQAVDLVMLVMNQHGMQALLSSHFKLGADASAAAGPVGRLAEGMTDISMRAEILTYSRARGLFAGVSLNGAVVKQHKDDTRAFYGRMIPFKLLLTGAVIAPEEAHPFLEAVAKYNKVNTPASATTTAGASTSTPSASNSSPTTSSAAATTAAPATTGSSAPDQNSTMPAQPASQAQPASNAMGDSSSQTQDKPDPTTPKLR
ncbi:MAG TPA: lipid-binding SYLF domain-containing protein [Terriglobales bacterium]|jgi:lipid-binding SYLF domain-containing protein|nr:lipid-binding SYLF domain-containing protein [Terriglobales bacterium]